MNRVVLSLSLSVCMAGGLVRAQESWRASSPAATLGAPRANLGTPMPLAELGRPVPAVAAIGPPVPVVRGQMPDVGLPSDSFGEGPRQMPKAEITEGNPPFAAERLHAPQSMRPMPFLGRPVPSGLRLDCDTPALGSEFPVGPSVADDSRWYGSAEYLLWWTRSMSVPVLVTTGPSGSGGILGVPGVTPLFGGDTLDPSARFGIRINLGYWCGDCREWGVDAGLFVLGNRGTDFLVSSATVPVLARPFFAPNGTTAPVPGLNLPGPFAEVVADPLISTGAVRVRTDSMFWGADINARHRASAGCGWRFDWLAGYRFLHLTEDLEITEQFRGLPNATMPAIVGVNGSVVDHFRTANQFHGPQLGAIFEWQRNRWTFDIRTKVALGVSVESADINGVLTQSGPTIITPTVPGGLLALNSNIGHYNKESFAVVPEVNLNIGYNVTQRLRVFAGYTFLYWSSVLRPGDQIDPVLDITRIPVFTDPRLFPAAGSVLPLRTPRPVATLKETDFWAQGFSIGLRFDW